MGLALLGAGAAAIALTLGLLFWPEAHRHEAVKMVNQSAGEPAPARSAASSASPVFDGFAIDGLVIDQGGVPVSGAAIHVTSRAVVRSGPDGRFHVGGLRAGRYDLSAYAGGEAAGPLSLEIAHASLSVVVRLRPGASVAVDAAPRARLALR